MGFFFAVLFVIIFFWRLKDVDLFPHSYFFSEGKKELKIWFPAWFIQLVNGVLFLLFITSFITTFTMLANENWLFAIISLTISIIGVFYFRTNLTYHHNIYWVISTVENIDTNGFEIQLIKNGKIQSIQKILWENIAKANLKKKELRLHTKSGKKIFLTPSTKHFYTLIRRVPKNFTNVSHQQINIHFKGLKPCLICGSVAANGYQCKACETYIWRKEFSKHYNNKRDYVKAKQLDLFASLQKNGQQALTFNRDETFQLHKNWKLLVSEEEIQKYSRKKIWVL